MYSEEDEAFDLAQLVRDYLEPPESFHYVSTKSSKASDLKHQSTCLSVKEIVSEHTEKELEIEEKVSDHLESLAKTVPFVNEQKKHLVTKLKMDGYNALLCNTDYVEYIEVKTEDKRMIVDIEFRSQFEVVKSTRNYKELTNTLPSVFVGNEEKLDKLTTVMCPATLQTFIDNHSYVPPWRKIPYVKSKWLANKCTKLWFQTTFNAFVKCRWYG